VTGTFIGVDVGGTKVASGRLHGNTMSESTLQATCLDSGEALIDQFVDLVGEVRGDDDLDGVGIGVPSVVEFATGKVVSSANIPLADVPLREVLGERLGVPVFVDNDATVAALAEAHDESLRLVAHDLVILTIGTGVGGGLVLGGRIYRGATGGAGELGHTLVGLDLSGGVPEPGDFPQKGSLEWEAAGLALDRLAQADAEQNPDTMLGRRLAAGEPVLGPDAVKAARDGDEKAQQLIERWGCRLGIGVANAINTFDPEEVVIAGGGAQAGDLLLNPAERVARQWVLPGLGGKTTIRLARHGVGAGVLGAALLAEQELGGGSERRAGDGSVQTTEVSE
jgi:glucokinase